MKKTTLLITVFILIGTLVITAGYANGLFSGNFFGMMNRDHYGCEDFTDENEDGICDYYGISREECLEEHYKQHGRGFMGLGCFS